MSLVLAILQEADMVHEGETILDAEERGHFLSEDLEQANLAVPQVVRQGYSSDVVSLTILLRDLMEQDNVVGVAHCTALLADLIDQYTA